MSIRAPHPLQLAAPRVESAPEVLPTIVSVFQKQWNVKRGVGFLAWMSKLILWVPSTWGPKASGALYFCLCLFDSRAKRECHCQLKENVNWFPCPVVLLLSLIAQYTTPNTFVKPTAVDADVAASQILKKTVHLCMPTVFPMVKDATKCQPWTYGQNHFCKSFWLWFSGSFLVLHVWRNMCPVSVEAKFLFLLPCADIQFWNKLPACVCFLFAGSSMIDSCLHWRM